MTSKPLGPPSTWSLDQFAEHYVETLSAQPNAWGQHISRVLGKSSGWIMQDMFYRWGEAASNAAIECAFRARKGDS